ncbi:GHKL domain-containing protein [Rossellomorea aquimaris]|uniref:sensor histidine kinase n=1 Tax=Rossellomorea aquimaris TaxID=189382 RepID=UPI001CD6EB8B|nr:GHKL domain-containing protein [Rossellomorea aquimaris]MCA1055716.1 GHKL domain-containing protein [Rossellomorea aquimaris]
MKHQIFWYWAYIAVFSFIHLHFFFKGFQVEHHYLISTLITLSVTFILYRNIHISLLGLGARWNYGIFIWQCVILAIYLGTEPAPIYGGLFTIFIGIECVRIVGSRKISGLTQSIKQFEEEQEQLNETFRTVRSERHDFLKHISALHFMLEHTQVKEAKAYLDDLVDGYEETNLSIRGERGSVAGILHTMYKKGRKLGIDVIYDLDMPLSTLPFSDKDLVTLLGNLLSNSLDACEEFQQKKGNQATMTLQFYKRSGLYLLFCENDTTAIPAHILDKLYESYGHTTKAGHHEGLGTKLIDDVVKKHGGYLDFIHKDEKFMVKIKFPAIH